MLKYQSHKVVEAAKITHAIESRQPGGDVVIEFEDGDPIKIKRSVYDRICSMAIDAGYDGVPPIIGGWLMQYPDLYISWSPAQAFEEGYSELGGGLHPAPQEFTEEEIATDHILRYFHYAHLPAHLQPFSAPFCDVARLVINTLPRNPERTVALRKLLEAKDAAVRANI